MPALLCNSSGNFATLAAVLETVAEEEMPAVQETIERVRHIDVDQYKYSSRFSAEPPLSGYSNQMHSEPLKWGAS